MNRNFKVGDRVRIRSWDDMANEFGVDSDGDIEFEYTYFKSYMKHLCGREATISRIDSQGDVRLNNLSNDSEEQYIWFSVESLEYIGNEEKEKEEEETMGLEKQIGAFSKVINGYYDLKKEELECKYNEAHAKLSSTFKYNILHKNIKDNITKLSSEELKAFAGEGATITLEEYFVCDKDGNKVELVYDKEEEKKLAELNTQQKKELSNLQKKRDYTLNYIKTFETANEIRQYLVREGIIEND